MTRAKDLDNIAPDDPIKSTSNTIKDTTNYDNIKDDTIRQILGHTKHPLSSTLIYPHFFNFSERGENEIIYVVLRSHWFTNIHWLTIAILMIFAPSLVKFIPMNLTIPFGISLILFLFWYLVTFAFILEQFISWYFDIFIISNLRVIDIDVKNILDRSFKEAQIDRIQDISYKVAGVSQTLFNYGSVVIETAGENPEISFEKVSNPAKVLKVLQYLTQQCSHP
jgi:hypothetical protein